MQSVAAKSDKRPQDQASLRFEAVKRSTLKEQSYNELRRSLLSGRFEPGAQVTIRELAEALSSGVMPVREAVQRLIAEGALASLPSGRVCVPRLTRQAFEQIAELRLILEPLAAEKAATAADRDLTALALGWHQQIVKAVEDEKPEELLWANYQFHFVIYRAAAADVLAEHIESLWLRAGPMITNLFRTPEQKADFLTQGSALHLALIDGLHRRDGPEARVAMIKIIATAAEWHRQSFPFADFAV